ncbi:MULTISPECIES: basic secretory protein-like protein [Mucilaginibacter]|nr:MULTISPECIES: basic secretory protein-like protein [Mucilaginibacter]EHQ27407.1 Basic Secretory Protein [Mucilaginibacter paludis DSM 18603]
MKIVFKIIPAIFLLTAAIRVNAQNKRQWQDIDTSGFHTRSQNSKNGFTLITINKDSLFSAETLQRIKNAFWQIYPREVKRYNKKALRTVTILIGNDYKGVAATLNGVVKIDQDWLTKNPEDIDVFTHELMHIVQGYTYNVPDNWLTDGIADYARYTFGVNNSKSGWALPAFQNGQSYKNSYRVAARFLVWVEQYKNKNIVKKLDEALRQGNYQPAIWQKLTGSKLDELWTAYAANPMLKTQ